MQIQDLRVECVYEGADGTTHRILDLSGQVCRFVGPDGYVKTWSKQRFAKWAQKQLLIIDHTVDDEEFIKSCPGCGSLRVYMRTFDNAVVCFKCGFTGPGYGRPPGRKITKSQQIRWWNNLGKVTRR